MMMSMSDDDEWLLWTMTKNDEKEWWKGMKLMNDDDNDFQHLRWQYWLEMMYS